MKIILTAIHAHPSPQAVPLANAFLKASVADDQTLAGRGEIHLLDFYCADPALACAERILALEPDAVGFSVYVWNRMQSAEIARIMRQRKPELRIFAGGPEATADADGLLAEAPFDFLIVGEGEATFNECFAAMADGLDPAGISGTHVRQGRGKAACRRQSIAPLDSLPSPYLKGVIDVTAYGGVLWQLSRGCDFSCDYCFDPQGERGVRRFSLERLEAELVHFVRRNVAQVFVLDSTFNVDVPRAKKILRLIKRKAPHIHFHFEARAEFIDREMARLFAEITCSLQIGLQSADPAVLKRVRRSLDRDDFINRIGLLNASGACFGFDLIYGLPGDTLRGFADSLDFALALYPNHLDIFPLAVLPGAPLARKSRELGLRHQDKPPYLVQETPTFLAGEMAAAGRLATACDIFFSRGRAVAWFNAIVAPLKMRPSEFLDRFHQWLSQSRADAEVHEQQFSDEQIWQLQKDFVSAIYRDRRKNRLLSLALDLIDYNSHYAAALIATPPELPTDRELAALDYRRARFQVAASARLATFNYEITDILEAGEPDLAEFAACFAPCRSFAVIYPRAGEVLTESLHEKYFSLLNALDGKTPAHTIASRLRIPPNEAFTFLEFAAAEGFIVLVNGRSKLAEAG